MKFILFLSLLLITFGCDPIYIDKCERTDETLNYKVVWDDYLVDSSEIDHEYFPRFPILIYDNSLIYPKKTDKFNNTKIVKRNLDDKEESKEIIAEGLWKNFIIHNGKIFYIYNSKLKSIDLEIMENEDNIESLKNTVIINGLDDKIYLSKINSFGADTILKQEIISYDIYTNEMNVLFSKVYSIADNHIGSYKWYSKIGIPKIWKNNDGEKIITYFDTYKKYTSGIGLKEQFKLVSYNLDDQEELFQNPIDSLGLHSIDIQFGHIIRSNVKGAFSKSLFVYDGLTGEEKWKLSDLGAVYCISNPINESILVDRFLKLEEYSIEDGKILSTGEPAVYDGKDYFYNNKGQIYYFSSSNTIEKLETKTNCSQVIFRLSSDIEIESLYGSIVYDDDNSILYLRSNLRILAIEKE